MLRIAFVFLQSVYILKKRDTFGGGRRKDSKFLCSCIFGTNSVASACSPCRRAHKFVDRRSKIKASLIAFLSSFVANSPTSEDAVFFTPFLISHPTYVIFAPR